MTNFHIVLIDDLRSFREETPAHVIRTAAESTQWLDTLSVNDTIEQLWLDHDLGEDENGVPTDIMSFVNKLEEMTFFHKAPVIDEIIVHTSNSVGGKQIVAALERFYNVRRVYAGDYFSV